MDVLYCSTLISLNTSKKLSNILGFPLSSVTIQKFHRLVVRGFLSNNSSVEVLSVPPSYAKFFNKIDSDLEDSVLYHYISTIQIPFIRHLCILIGSFFYTINWHRRKRNCPHVAICDVLNISLSIALVISKLFGVRVVGIVTDMPGMLVGDKKNFLAKIVAKINLSVLKFFDGYIFLTEAMNEVINIKNRPYIVMEGIADPDMLKHERHYNNVRNIIYAGGIFKRYGLISLIEAFYKLKDIEDITLTLYGSIGNDIPEGLDYYLKRDSRLHYMGVIPNADLLEAELSAFLLVNPRPSTEEFTKYSFPSKNMEYMSTGVPVLSMSLPGLPSEYHDYLLICFDESAQGIADKLFQILHLSDDELWALGQSAKEFVLEKKDCKTQSYRILQLLNCLCG